MQDRAGRPSRRSGPAEPPGPTGPGDRFGDESRVTPRGGVVRRLRHQRGWSARQLLEAVAAAQERATGLTRTLTPEQLAKIEDRDEPVPYETLCLLADGLDCDPIDLLGEEPPQGEEPP